MSFKKLLKIARTDSLNSDLIPRIHNLAASYLAKAHRDQWPEPKLRSLARATAEAQDIALDRWSEFFRLYNQP